VSYKLIGIKCAAVEIKEHFNHRFTNRTWEEESWKK